MKLFLLTGIFLDSQYQIGISSSEDEAVAMMRSYRKAQYESDNPMDYSSYEIREFDMGKQYSFHKDHVVRWFEIEKGALVERVCIPPDEYS